MFSTPAGTSLPRAATYSATPAQRYRLIAGAVSLCALILLVSSADNPWPALATFAPVYFNTMALPPLALLILHLLATRFRALIHPKSRQKWQDQNGYAGYFGNLALLDIAVALASITLTISCFTVYKAQVVGASGYHYDAALIAVDRAIFFGSDPWRLTHQLFSDAKTTALIDKFYHPAFLPMLLGYVVCVFSKSLPTLRYTYMTAYIASFLLIGMVAASLMNSAGPIYDGLLFGDGQTFADLNATLRAQAAEVGGLYSQTGQTYLLTAYQDQVVKLGSGISAMPSMHIVMAFLWVFAAFTINKKLGTVVLIYGLFIWAASVHLGWHYFSDGLVGLAMLCVIWWALARFIGASPTPRAV
jgi:hypothetical protein